MPIAAQARRRFARLRDEYYRGFWEAAARQAGAECEEAGAGLLQIRRGAYATFVSGQEAMADSPLAVRIAGDTALVRRLLETGRHPVPRHVTFDLATVRSAVAFWAQVGGAVVVKPARGAGDGGITTGIVTGEQLRRASIAAAVFFPHLVAEEQIPGEAYRLLYLDGRLIDAVERGRPVVIGDGIQTIRQLMVRETLERLEHRPIRALRPLAVDADCALALQAQGATASSVPPAGERILVKGASSQNSAREQRSVLARVHPAIARLGARIVAQLGLELAGIDLLTPDISVPLGEGGGAVIGIATAPALHHHALVSGGDAVPVGALVLEHVLDRQRRLSVRVGASAEGPARIPARQPEPTEPPVIVTAGDLEAFALSVLCASGARGSQARQFAEILVWNDRIGRATHGIRRLGAYCRRVELGLIRCPCAPVFRHTAASTATLDGDAGFGPYVGHVAMRRAVALARTSGAGVVLVSNSNHFASAAYYVELAARQRMIGIALSNSTPRVAAFGGTAPVFGTNPLAFGAPRRNQRSVLIDMATSAIAGAHLIECAERGRVLAPGVAIDADGRATIDPARASEGALLPFGGAKGSGISLMIEILSGVLSGAACSQDVRSMFTDFRGSGQNGHAFLAIDIARFLPLDTYYDRLETLIGIVTQSGTSERPIRIPGQARWDACDRATRDGIPLEPSTARALEALAGRYGIPVPWTGVPPFFGLPSPLAGPALVPGPFEMTDPRPLQAS